MGSLKELHLANNIVEKISKFEDEIEGIRFAIASIKIQSAFRIMMKVIDKRMILYKVRFLSRVKDMSKKKIVHGIERPLKIIFQNLQKAETRNVMKAFVKIKIQSQRNICSYSPSQNNKPLNSAYQLNTKISSPIVPKTNEQIEEQCKLLKNQIKNIQNSFHAFYNNLSRK